MAHSDPEDAKWFSENLQVHEPMLRAWLHSRFPNLVDVDDIVQQAYERMLTARQHRDIHSPKAFFFATARNLAYDHYRKNKIALAEPLGDFDVISVLDETSDVAEAVSRNQEVELMTQAIQSLPDRCRQVLTLRCVYGLPRQEIARQLGISVRTVEAQITVGIKRCTRYVAKYRRGLT